MYEYGEQNRRLALRGTARCQRRHELARLLDSHDRTEPLKDFTRPLTVKNRGVARSRDTMQTPPHKMNRGEFILRADRPQQAVATVRI